MENNTELLNEKLTELLIWIEEGVKTSKDFVVEQAPLFIQELLAWNFWISLIAFVIWTVVWVSIIWTLLSGFYQAFKYGWGEEEPSKGAIKVMVGVCATLIGCMAYFLNDFHSKSMEWLQISIAPRVWLVEYLQKML